jgi:excisionase family DNA binding protein
VERKDSAAPQHTTITIPEIADRLDVCEETVYEMLKARVIPSIRPGRRFIISRTAYEKWEATIGEKPLDVHHNTRPGCREDGSANWHQREDQLFARDELLEQLKKSKIGESN